MSLATPSALEIGSRRFEWGRRTYVMGVVNLSPESFAGDGLAGASEAARQAERFEREGADLIDVGGQSTRPGFAELSVEAEIERVVPAVRALVAAVDLPVSIDTYRAPVAAAALAAGAHLVNDISGLRHDPEMAGLIGRAGVAAVVMHNQRERPFHDVIGDIRAGLAESVAVAAKAGVRRDRLIVDPGFGFGWTVAQNMEMLRRLGELRDLGLPILVGTSRKSAIGTVLGREEPGQRLWGTAATVALAIANGADIVRVHDVREMTEVSRMTDAIVRPPRRRD